MSKLPILSAAELEKILKYLGFVEIRQKGSHKVFQHPDGRKTVIPFHKGEDIGRGLLRSILNDIDLSPKEFIIRRNKPS